MTQRLNFTRAKMYTPLDIILKQFNPIHMQPISLSSMIILGIHYAGLSDMHGASQNVLLAHAMGASSNLKMIHLVMTQSLNQCYTTKCYRSFFV
jgi:hypothetical protein